MRLEVRPLGVLEAGQLRLYPDGAVHGRPASRRAPEELRAGCGVVGALVTRHPQLFGPPLLLEPRCGPGGEVGPAGRPGPARRRR